MSPNLTLRPDRHTKCIEVSGRCRKKQTKTQHICFIRLLMKKSLQKMKDQTSESRLATDFFITMSFVQPVVCSKVSCCCSWCKCRFISRNRSDLPSLITAWLVSGSVIASLCEQYNLLFWEKWSPTATSYTTVDLNNPRLSCYHNRTTSYLTTIHHERWVTLSGHRRREQQLIIIP